MQHTAQNICTVAFNIIFAKEYVQLAKFTNSVPQKFDIFDIHVCMYHY